jgi:hypothetical protein
MFKSEAIAVLGGTVAGVAREVGISPQAVGQWPEELPPAIRDRVQAALWRRQQSSEAELTGAPPTTDPQPFDPTPFMSFGDRRGLIGQPPEATLVEKRSDAVAGALKAEQGA